MSDKITINFQRGAGRPSALEVNAEMTVSGLLESLGLGATYSVAEDGIPVEPSAPIQPARTYTAAENHKGA